MPARMQERRCNMDFTQTELIHMRLAMTALQDPMNPCETCDGVIAKIDDELRKMALVKETGIEKIPVPEEYRKLGVLDWEKEV
jgi:hypothetical protein